MPRSARRTCTVPGCERPHWGHGYCRSHHRRWLRTGSAQPNRPIAVYTPKPLPRRPFGIPVCGPIARTPFDPQAAREAQADAAFELAHTPTASRTR